MAEETTSSKLTENVISSIINLYLALFSLALICGYASWTQLKYFDNYSKLYAMDHINAPRTIARDRSKQDRDAHHNDLPEFFPQANKAVFAPHQSDLLASLEEFNRRFPKSTAEGGKYHSNIPMPTRNDAFCKAATFSLSPGHTFRFYTIMTVSKGFEVDSENVSLVAMDLYCGGQAPLALVFKDGEDIVFALPRSLQQAFPGISTNDSWRHYPFLKPEVVRVFLPSYLSKYFELAGCGKTPADMG